MSSNSTYDMFTSLKWAPSMVHINWYIIYCKHNNLERSIQLLETFFFLYWMRNHEFCNALVLKMIYRLSTGCHIVSPAPVWVQIPGHETRVWGEAEYPGGGILGSVLIPVKYSWQSVNLCYNHQIKSQMLYKVIIQVLRGKSFCFCIHNDHQISWNFCML